MQRSFASQQPFPSRWQSTQRTSTIRFILALAIALQGVLNGLVALLPLHLGPLAPLAPFAPVSWAWRLFSISHDMALFLGFFLVLISVGLARGKRQAWYLAAALLPLSLLAHLLRGSGSFGTLSTLFLLLGLMASQPLFRIKSDPWRCRQGFFLLGIGWLLFFAYSASGFTLLQQQFVVKEDVEGFVRDLLLHVLHLHPSVIIPLTAHASWFLRSLSYLSALILVTGLFFLLRPISLRWWTICHKERLEALRLKAVEMVHEHGGQTLSFFALAPENLPYIAPRGEGLIHYRLSGKVATVPGDPICSSEKFEHVTRAFLNMCRANDWQVSFYQAHPRHLEDYEELGLHAYKIGEEAIIDLHGFTLSGSAMSNVRCTCRRAERENVRVAWYEGVPPEAIRAELQVISDTWLAQKTGKRPAELGFSMGRFSDLVETAKRADLVAYLQPTAVLPHSPRFVTGVAFTHEGRACAFVTFTPLYGSQESWGWALDLVRRAPVAPAGATELLLVKAIERFRGRQATLMSLGMIAMADSNQEMTPTQRQLASFATEHLHLLEEHRSLYHFKKKFQPHWESRYMVTSGTLALPRAALAILRVHQA